MKPQKRAIGHVIQQPLIIGQPAPRRHPTTKARRKLPQGWVRPRIVGRPVRHYGKAERVKGATQ